MKPVTFALAAVGTLASATLVPTALVPAALAHASSPSAPAASRPHTETFSILSTTDPSRDTVIATGAFTDGGTDHASHTLDKITLTRGTLWLRHHGHAASHLDAKTCLLTTHGTGSYRLTHGTGAYAALAGSGHYDYVVRVLFRTTPKGTCSGKVSPAAVEYVVHASGPVTTGR